MALLQGTSKHPGPSRESDQDLGREVGRDVDQELARLRSETLRAGPDVDDVLDVVIERAATLLDAPARLAEPIRGKLIWSRAFGDDKAELGSVVDTDETISGAAWSSGIVQFTGPSLSARCCGSPVSAIAVPIVHAREPIDGGHAGSGQETYALVVLTADRADWFGRADVRPILVVAAAAAERIHELIAAGDESKPEANKGNRFGGWFGNGDGREPGDDAEPKTQSKSEPKPEPEPEPEPEPKTQPVPKLLPPRPKRQPTPGLTAPRKPGLQPPSTLPAAMPSPDSMGLWQWDALTGACTWSSPVSKLLGFPPEQKLTLEMIASAVAPQDQERFGVAVKAITSGRGVAGAIKLACDGKERTAYAWSEVRRDETGVLLGAWGGVVDVSAFDHDAAQLRSGLTAQRAAQELAGLATWQWRPAQGELVWSPEMFRLLGVSPDTFTPTLESWHACVHPDDASRARMLDLDALNGYPGRIERMETFRLIGRSGEIRHVQSWSAVSRDDLNSADLADLTVYGATIDVTRQVRDRIMLEQLSATDPVTGLGNRLAFDQRISELLARPGTAVTLMLLDLDRFKVVNDSLGHQIGDRLLIEVARRLVALVPDDSVTARMGGDEFVVVPPPGATQDAVRRLAMAIVDALRAPYILPETGEMLICPASIGIAMSARKGRPRRVTGHDLLREADIALYQAKDGGRDRFVIFDEELRDRTQVRARAERRLRSALQEGRLVMEYQPVIDFVNGRLAGAEGLVRLRDDEDGDEGGLRLVPPDLFMDIAEQTGLVVEVDSWVIETAIAQLVQWSAHSQHGIAETGDPGELPWLAINLSSRSMEHPRVVRRLIEAVKRGELARGRLKIELTERSFIGSLPGVEASVRQLIANGIDVGIDDFGTGYSALAYLQNFHLDFMKIDRSFMISVGDNPRSDAVVAAIVDLAHAHGMAVIAEGVETSRQARRLREIGCDFAQGYHFGRPGAPSRITAS